VNYVPGHRSLWVFDFDGTLSRIVPDRRAAWLDAECERMLRFLQASPWNQVAVISSRTLDDLASRIPVPMMPMGGASGMEWELPGGYRSRPEPTVVEMLARNRRAVGALLNEFAAISGVEIEDKGWSVAIHFRDATSKSFRRRTVLLQRLRTVPGIRVYRGHEVVEVPLLSGGNKAAGVRRLCQLIGWDFSRDRLVYAGDDENDATAIRWVLGRGGAAIVVGNRISDPGAGCAEEPADLAAAVYALASAHPERIAPVAGQAVFA
jgi:trehalose 6-phosphate phosphatase